MRRVLFTCAVLLLVALPLVAQDDSQPLNCESETIAAALNAAQEGIAEALASYEDDPAVALDMMAEVSTTLDLVYTECHGLVFEENNPKLLGPIAFPDGMYRVTVTTEGFFIAHVTTVAGTCDPDRGSLFNLSAGDANEGAEALMTMEGCTALIETSNTSAPWTLTFDNIVPATKSN